MDESKKLDFFSSQISNVSCFLDFRASYNAFLSICLTATQLFYNTSSFKFLFEFFECSVNAFAFFNRNNQHNLYTSFKFGSRKYACFLLGQVLFQNLSGNHQFLYFRGSFSNGAELRIAVEFFYRKVFGIAISTKNLNRFGRNFY